MTTTAPIQRRVLTLLHERPVPAHGSAVIDLEVPIDPTLASLPIVAVTTIADGGTCRPRWLRINNEGVSLEEDPVIIERRVVRGNPIRLGTPGTTCLVSLTIRNEGPRPSTFRGALLLGTWDDPPDHGAYCRHGGPCRIPISGGACPGCNYPRAFAHPTTLLEAFEVDQIFIRGTAMQVYPDPGVDPTLVWIEQHDGKRDAYPIPTPKKEKRSRETGDRALQQASPRQFQADAASTIQALGVHDQARLLERAAHLMRASTGEQDPQRTLARALVAGVDALSRDHLDWEAARRLTLALSEGTDHRLRTILQEVGHAGRAWRVRKALPSGAHLIRHDTRPETSRYVSSLVVGPIADPVSRIRIALLPQEAAHVRIYDLRVGSTTGPDRSVLHLVPGFGPEAVREEVPMMSFGERYQRYLPGFLFAGRLIEDVDLDQPYEIPSNANILAGGLQVELDQPLAPMACVHLLYQVDAGHQLLGVVECQPARPGTS